MSPVLQSRNVTYCFTLKRAGGVETSHIAALLARFFSCLGSLRQLRVPSVISAPIWLVLRSLFSNALLLLRSFVLLFLDVLKHSAQPLVLGYRSMCNALIFVEGREGQQYSFASKLQTSVRELIAVYIFSDQTTREIVLLKNNPHAIIGER